MATFGLGSRWQRVGRERLREGRLMDGPERLENYRQRGHVTEQGGRLKGLYVAQVSQSNPSASWSRSCAASALSG